MTSGNTVFDTIIGLSFFYFILSVVASSLNEATSGVLSLRAKTLKKGVGQLLDDPKLQGLAKSLYEHPLVKGTTRGRHGPSYIAKGTFALALVDVVAKRTGGAIATLSDLRRGTQGLEGSAKGALSAILDETVTDIAHARAAVEDWFDSAMARVSGTYKRWSRFFVVLWAVALTAGLNADSLALTRALATDPALRQAVVTAAQHEVETRAPPPTGTASNAPPDLKESLQHLDSSVSDLTAVQLPIGWTKLPTGSTGWLAKLLGLVFTAIAVSLGGPFWFDLLNRFVNLRSTGTRPDSGSAQKG